MASVAATDLAGRVRAGSRRAAGTAAAYGDRLVAAGLAASFIAISIWWSQVDDRVPNGDNAKHTMHAFGYLDQFEVGHWLSPILVWTQYPPLVHVVGATGAAIGGRSVDTVVITENLVFVPLLALGCYQVGRRAFGQLTGVLAVVFAFAAPMTISLFHVFMLDAPAAALVALSLWFLVASRRFESLPWTLAAAAAVAAGMYIKATFTVFVLGFVIALLIRGGWQRWRHVVLGAGLFVILVQPWYFAHLQDLRGMTTGAIRPQAVLWYGPVPYPDRWSIENFTWYWWNLINNQLYVPLTAFFLVGLIVLVIGFVRRRERDSYVPELVGGAGFAYVAISMLSLDDPRYTFPALVYAAVLGTGWIERLPAAGRIAAAGALGTVLLVNTVLLNYVRDVTVQPTLPGYRESPIGERTFTIFSSRGYIEGRPVAGGIAPKFIELLRRARADGADAVVFQPESMNNGGYNLDALAIFARTADLHVPGYDPQAVASLQPNDIYVFRVARDQVDRPACLKSWDETGIYMFKGPPALGKQIYCPPPDA